MRILLLVVSLAALGYAEPYSGTKTLPQVLPAVLPHEPFISPPRPGVGAGGLRPFPRPQPGGGGGLRPFPRPHPGGGIEIVRPLPQPFPGGGIGGSIRPFPYPQIDFSK